MRATYNIFFFIVKTYSKLPTSWVSNCSSSNILDWQFLHLCRYSTNGILPRSGEAEVKKLQRSRQDHFLGTSSPHSFPPDRFTLRCSHVTQGWACSQATSMIMTTLSPVCYAGHYLQNSCKQHNDKNVWTKKPQLTWKLLKGGQDVVKNCNCFLVIFQLSFNKLKKEIRISLQMPLLLDFEPPEHTQGVKFGSVTNHLDNPVGVFSFSSNKLQKFCCQSILKE